MTALRVVQSHRVTLDNQAVRSCRAGASLGTRCGAGARLRATGVDRWGYRNSRSVKFAVSAVVDAGVSANQADSGAGVPAESLSMYFKVVFFLRFSSDLR